MELSISGRFLSWRVAAATAAAAVAAGYYCRQITEEHWYTIKYAFWKLGIWWPLAPQKWPLDAWLEQIAEDAIDPDMEIIDAHHHLWDLQSEPKEWLPGSVDYWNFWYSTVTPEKTMQAVRDAFLANGGQSFFDSFGWPPKQPFYQPYTYKDLLLDIRNRDRAKQSHNVVKTVYVESGWTDKLLEVRAAAQVHRKCPNVCNGITASANLAHLDVDKTLAALAQEPLVSTIRHSLAWTSDPGISGAGSPANFAADPDFRRGFALLQKYSLNYEVWMFHEQLSDIVELAKAFPEQIIIVDHVAEPLGIQSYSRESTFPVWQRGVMELARASPHVYMKLSGLGMIRTGFRHHELPVPPSSAQLAEEWGPYFRVVLEAFGVERCLFASNFPVDKVSSDYTVMWNAFKLIVKDFSAEDKRLLFSENARKIYRL
mmetsp:Transcript_15780/g.37104  ORF Transcript_15780/g.37104 Transcript_15780/m.37104 type:complete len:428 (-) Transcript_15780:170-1453(-)